MPQNDGEVRVEITGDNSKIKKKLKETKDDIQNTTQAVSEMTDALEDLSGASDNFDDIAESAEEAAKAISGASEEAKKLGEEVSKPVALPDIGESLEKRISQILSASSKEINNIEKQLSEIDNALQLNPGNVELLGQKFSALSSQIRTTSDKLNQLKAVEQEVTQKFANDEIGAEQYNVFRREIINTESSLNSLIAAQDSMLNESGKLRDVTNKMDNLGDSIKNAGQQSVTFGDLLKANLLSDYIQKGISKLADGFWSFMQNGVDLASQLQEVQNVVDTTFGNGAEHIYEWSDAAAESFGMSSLQAQNFNGTLGAMLKSMGLTDDAVLKMSTDMVGLAGDMASFYNLDIEQAFEKIRSGLSGETEPLKQLGINMSVANLEAYALAQGIETAYDKMSQSEQAILRYNYLMSVTADAQGDFAKTSDSFANQQRILELQTQNLAASLGEKLLPSLNNVLGAANEKLPKLENTAENIGEIIGNITEFALENHEAILSLITAYGTFYGVMKAGNAVNTAITAIKTLTAATKSAETAQHSMNAAAAANPYVLLASAIAAVTIGLITYANTVDSVHNSIKDVNAEVKELKKNTEESISSTEAEIAVFKDKAAQYEELLNIEKRTAGQEEQLARLAEELQGYMPEGTKLIDEQTGAYNSLADSVDSVAEAMRRKATIAAYEEEYTELIKQQLEAQKNLEEAAEKYKNFFENGGKAVSANWIQNSIHSQLKEDFDNAEESYSNAKSRLEELDSEISKLYEQSPKPKPTSKATGSIADYYQQDGERQLAEDQQHRADDLADYENNLKAKVDELDKSLTLRKISEDEYYGQLGEYITQNRNLESEEYYRQLDKYNSYLDKKQDAADKAAEQRLKAEKSAAEKRQKEAESTAKKAQQEAEKAAKKSQQEAEKLLSQQEKTVSNGLSDILKKFQSVYDELEKKRENYKKKLLSIGGDIFSVNEIENPDGSKTEEYAINNISEQLKKVREYHAAVMKLKNEGASAGLLEELTSLDDDKSAEFAKYLSRMSEAEFSKINALYNEKQKLAEELSNELYADDYKAISDGVDSALDEVSAGAADKGKEAAEIYAKAFSNELAKHSEDFYALLGNTGTYKKWFENSADAQNLFSEIGNTDKFLKLFSGADFANIAAKVMATVRSEQARYSAAAYTAPVIQNNYTESQTSEYKKSAELEDILKKLNKPVQLVVDGKVIAETVMTYKKSYKRQSGG